MSKGSAPSLAHALLEEGLEKLGLYEERAVTLLNLYMDEIERFNGAYGLVKVNDREDLVVRHILDSLAPLEILRRFLQSREGAHRPSVADVGSGAGFPGLPLAVCLSGADFTLIERMGRRAGFLRNALAVLGLPNARLEEAEMERLPIPAGSGFDLAVFRAFRPLEGEIIKKLSRLLAPCGSLAAYKGRRKAVEEEMARASASAGEKTGGNTAAGTFSWEIIPLEVPFLEEERHLLLIKN